MSHPVVGRYAPSPSGRMHIGNVFSCLISYVLTHQRARESGTTACMRLRIEDLDPARSKQCYIDQIISDLSWFGFTWDGEVLYQSKRTEAYQRVFERLIDQGLVYPCYCSRADLHSAQAPHRGDEVLYAGTCRPGFEASSGIGGPNSQNDRSPAYRLLLPQQTILAFDDYFQGVQEFTLEVPGDDFIIRRSDGVFAYQFAVVLDDIFQGVTCVVRGEDLLSSTAKQLYLQKVLDCYNDGDIGGDLGKRSNRLVPPWQNTSTNKLHDDGLGMRIIDYAHVPLIVDESGKRLSKRNQDATLTYLIDELHLLPEEILGLISFLSGIVPQYRPYTLEELVLGADLTMLCHKQTLIWPSSIHEIL